MSSISSKLQSRHSHSLLFYPLNVFLDVSVGNDRVKGRIADGERLLVIQPVQSIMAGATNTNPAAELGTMAHLFGPQTTVLRLRYKVVKS